MLSLTGCYVYLAIALWMLRLHCFRVTVPQCIVRFCGPIIRNQHLQRFVLHSTMLIEKLLVFLRGAVQVQCMQITISASS